MWVAKPLHLAFHDSLTGLKNRTALDELFKKKTNKTRRNNALVLIDLDNFKLVNDYLGHGLGDQLIKNTARVIRQIARQGDVAIRWGGGEFVLFLPSISKEEAERTAKKIIHALKEMTSNVALFEEVQVTASIGIALSPDDGIDQETLLKKADLALYASKEKGKNQYQFYENS